MSSSSTKTKDNLPPQRSRKGIRPVKPPLHSTSLNKFIYILVLLSTLITAYYSYRLIQWKTEVGGWWNLAVGRKPAQVIQEHSYQGQGQQYNRPSNTKDESVEDRINALATALGMPPKDLAKAIAGAVREYVPPASLSSIRERETAGPAVDVLLGEKPAPAGSVGKGEKQQDAGSAATGGFMDSFVGD
ncbi:hypothetical protein V5O48_007331 [Marasmius crinis-equi]|uniref:Uncharacterized protein n=1 Tax=Marasmius crinis-equi TaxID=585013 RepID=A0ABR3FH29_9AGAR